MAGRLAVSWRGTWTDRKEEVCNRQTKPSPRAPPLVARASDASCEMRGSAHVARHYHRNHPTFAVRENIHESRGCSQGETVCRRSAFRDDDDDSRQMIVSSMPG